MIHYNNCPVCNSPNINLILTTKDYTVSQQEFFIWHCNDCTFRFTQDVPSQDAISPYYVSENYISHSDTKKGLINKLYHAVRTTTLNAKKKMLIKETGLQKGKLLDIGCGTGAFLYNMQQAGWDITGLEPDVTARKKAGELYGLQPQEPGKLFELQPGSYNAITMWHVLEHVHELHAYIRQIAELIKMDGKIFIAVPNYLSADAVLYKEHWAAWDVPRHLYHFSSQSMEKLIGIYNLKLVAVKPMWYDSFYVSMLSEKYKNGKGNIVKAFWNGFVSNVKAIGNNRKCSSLIYIIGKE